MAIDAKNQINRSRGNILGEAGANEPFGFESGNKPTLATLVAWIKRLKPARRLANRCRALSIRLDSAQS